MSSTLAGNIGGPTNWAEYRRRHDGQRWEIIAGVPYPMAPSRSTDHQSVVIRLGSRLERALAGSPCRLFVAPTDVRLSDTDVVQPDLFVVCDPQRITPTHTEGTPDLVIEVLSPHTAARDLREKKALYENAGIAEYVAVAPLTLYAMRFALGTEGYGPGAVVGSDETLQLQVGGGVEIPLWEVFEMARPTQAIATAGHS